MSTRASISPSRPLSAGSPNTAPLALTPRSKVKAMLAALDGDDDDDQDSDKENERISSHALTYQSPKKTIELESNEKSAHHSPSPLSVPIDDHKDDTQSGDDDDFLSLPRKGTLASRMQTHASRVPLSEPAEESDDGEAAYDRVKRMMLAKQHHEQSLSGLEEVQSTSANEQDSLLHTTRESGLSEDASKGVSAQHNTRLASTSPSPIASLRSSPGLFMSPDRPVSRAEDDVSDPRSSSSASPRKSAPVANRLQALLERKRKEIQEQRQAGDLESLQEREENSDASLSPPSPPKHSKVQTLRVESETDDDREVGKKLTQQARPTRKASKKALEEMNRETQRLSRNMQLTHEARTKTKFPVADFLAKFNLGESAMPQSNKKTKPAQAASSSSAPGTSDVESAHTPETIPSSPPSLGQTPQKKSDSLEGMSTSLAAETNAELIDAAEDDEPADLKMILAQVVNEPSKRIPTAGAIENLENKPEEVQTKRYSAKRFAKLAKPLRPAADSDDDLEIEMTSHKSRLPVFDNLPAAKAREPGSIHVLRALAQLHDTQKHRDRGRKSMTSAELDAINRRRAREQAKIERDEKIQRLRDKGVLVQTAEEKEQEQMQLENLLEKARKEADDIAKREKEAAKKEGRDDDDDFPDSEYEDEDYDGSDEGEEEVQLSGSEDEEGGADDLETNPLEEQDELGAESDEAESEDADAAENSLLDNEAADGSDEDEEAEDQQDGEERLDDGIDLGSEDEIAKELTNIKSSRVNLRRKKVVISDDEDEDEEDEKKEQNEAVANSTTSLLPPQLTTPKQPPSDAFGFNMARPMGLGLSQVFAGTMAESQTQVDIDAAEDSQQDSLAFLRGMPPPDLPDFTTPQTNDSPSVRVQNSQVEETPTRRESQPSGPIHFETQTQHTFSETLVSEIPDPSQDVGFQVGDSQAAMTVPSYATVDTQPLASLENDASEHPKRKGRLVRMTHARQTLDDESDVEDVEPEPSKGGVKSTTYFDVMRDATKRPINHDEFDKKKSEAKGMVEEQAEESEDEYAGLGGASDDESTGEADEATKQMIDDEDEAVTNERDIAAYYAEKERREDEKGIEKLYKDVINGGLRRKRGAQDDLWESDDEDEIVARRRLAKQREFAKMRKALLADEKLGKIAENPKQQAFLQTVEDRDDTDDFDFLEQRYDEVSQVTDSQSSDARQVQPLSTISANNRKRTHSEYQNGVGASQEENQSPRSLRRTTKLTRPTSLADIRNTLSEIIGEPEALVESSLLASESPSHSTDEYEDTSDGDDEAEDSNHEDLHTHPAPPSPTEMPPPPVPASQLGTNPPPRNRRRTAPSAARATVIDRMALKRSASNSTDSAASASSDRLAFHAPAKTAFAGFRVPSLLRRATTNSSSLSASSASSSASDRTSGVGGLGGKESVKMGGTKKSSVNYYVRETERMARVQQVERERQEGRERVGRLRRSGMAGGIGALTGGSFG